MRHRRFALAPALLLLSGLFTDLAPAAAQGSHLGNCSEIVCRRANGTIDPTCSPPCSLPAFAWQDHFILLERLGNHELSGDSFTVPFSLNDGTPPFSATPFLESWYIPVNPLGSTTGPLYRFYSTLYGDHLDSRNATVTNYTNEMTLGHPWLAQQPGTQKVSRYIRTVPKFDHRTWYTLPAGFSPDAIWPNRWGFPREGAGIDACSVDQPAHYVAKSNGVLDLRYYRTWGDAIGYLAFHKPGGGVEQLTLNGPPWMIQTGFGVGSIGPCATCWAGDTCYNPAQAGAVDPWFVPNTARWAGSPILSTTETTTSVYDRVSEIKPLNINSGVWQGTDGAKLLLWRGTFRVQTTLGVVIGSTTYKDVLRLRFNAKGDADAPAVIVPSPNLDTFWPFLLTNSQGLASAHLTERLDLASGISTPLQPQWQQSLWICDSQRIKAPVTCAGQAVIVERTDGIAFGLYAPSVPQFYKVLFACATPPDANGSCPNRTNTVLFDTFKRLKLTTSYVASKEQDVFMVIGSYSDVRSRLLALHGLF